MTSILSVFSVCLNRPEYYITHINGRQVKNLCYNVYAQIGYIFITVYYNHIFGS